MKRSPYFLLLLLLVGNLNVCGDFLQSQFSLLQKRNQDLVLCGPIDDYYSMFDPLVLGAVANIAVQQSFNLSEQLGEKRPPQIVWEEKLFHVQVHDATVLIHALDLVRPTILRSIIIPAQ